jgi:hypothetical protein
MAALRIRSAVPTDAGDLPWRENSSGRSGRADVVVRDFHCSNLQPGGISAEMRLASLTMVLGSALLYLPFAFTQDLNAGAFARRQYTAAKNVNSVYATIPF